MRTASAVCYCPLRSVTVRHRYAHCQRRDTKVERIGLSDFVRLVASHHQSATARYCAYNPRNMQTAWLGHGNVSAALAALEKMYMVGVTEVYDASICWLRSLLLGRAACACPVAGATRGVSRYVDQTHVHVTHTQGGRSVDGFAQLEPNETWREIAARFTRADRVIHRRARARLQMGLAAFNLSCLLPAKFLHGRQ